MTKPIKWTTEVIKEGVARYLKEEGRLPTSRDFDLMPYLPSARQIQRMYGGLPTLRTLIGLEDIDYTKGDLRRAIASKGYTDGLDAEERLEAILIEKFGEPYVHTQKRYGLHLKNRYDFFVYCKEECFAVDVFTTGRPEYISINIRHKINKYKSIGPFTIYFVVAGEHTEINIDKAIKSLKILETLPNVAVRSEQAFLQEIAKREALELPISFKSSI
jgi:hypothetical protein